MNTRYILLLLILIGCEGPPPGTRPLDQEEKARVNCMLDIWDSRADLPNADREYMLGINIAVVGETHFTQACKVPGPSSQGAWSCFKRYTASLWDVFGGPTPVLVFHQETTVDPRRYLRAFQHEVSHAARWRTLGGVDHYHTDNRIWEMYPDSVMVTALTRCPFNEN